MSKTKRKSGWLIERTYDFYKTVKGEQTLIQPKHYWVNGDKWTHDRSKAFFFGGYSAKKRAAHTAHIIAEQDQQRFESGKDNCNRGRFSFRIVPITQSVKSIHSRLNYELVEKRAGKPVRIECRSTKTKTRLVLQDDWIERQMKLRFP